MDLALHVPALPEPGRAVHGHGFRAVCGGKGANQACAAARLGARASLIACVGADRMGDLAMAELGAAGVDVGPVVRRAGATTGVMIVATDPRGASATMVDRGANSLLEADDVIRQGHVLRRAGVVIVQLETTNEAVQAALGIARASGVPILFNPAPQFDFPSEWLGWCDLVVANEEEAGWLAGAAVRGAEQAAGAAQALRERGARNLVVTLGAGGAWVDGADWRGHVPAYPVSAIDTTGAGDAFIGALAARLLEGVPLQEAARFACAAAAITVTRYGAMAAIPDRFEVEQRMM